MIEALEAEIRRLELRRDFVAAALEAEQAVAADGEVYAMEAVHRHFQDRLSDIKPKPLKPVSPK